MKLSAPRRLVLLAAPAALALPALLGPLGEHPLAASTAQEADHDEDDSPLLAAMDEINAGLRNLRRAVKDPERRADCLAIVDEMQGAVLRAKREVPPIAAKQEGEAGARTTSGYRRMMAEVLATTARLEIAILDGDAEAAGAVLRELNELKAAGHERFQEAE